MSDKLYDILKYIAQIALPASATLYFAIASIWGLPYAEQIVGTITAVDAFLGVLLGISTSSYNKGLDDTDVRIMVGDGSGMKDFLEGGNSNGD